ncbi:MAG: amidohydrolase family protein [Candidatus Cryosericum sp.]
MNKLLIKNGTLLTMGGDRQPRKADLLVADGRIKRIDTAIDRAERPDTTIDATGMLVLPGFIFGHARLGFSLLRGQTDQILDDAERERTALRLIGSLDPTQVRCSAELGICQSVRSGVSTLFEGGAMRYTEQILEAARTLGFRLIAGRMLADNVPDWPEPLRMSLREQLSDAQALARDIESNNGGGLLTYAVSTTNRLLCTDECLVQAKALADAGKHPLKIVLTTDKSQIERMHRETGPQELTSLETLGVLGENTFLVNPSFASELEQNIIRKAGARVVINATADLKLGRPLSRLPEFSRKGTPVLPGFDSPLYGGRMDAMRELSVLATAFRPQYGPQTMPPEQVLSMVTCDAAKALGMGDELGTLEPGKRADIVIVDLGHDLFAQPGAHTNPYCRLVYESSADDVVCTIINGKIVYQNGKVLNCDEAALAEQANTELVRILEKA